MEDVDVLPFNLWKTKHEANKKEARASRASKGTKQPRNLQAYCPDEEAPPESAWSRLDSAFIDDGIQKVMNEILDIVNNAREEDKELQQLRNAAMKVIHVQPLKPVEVCLVGQQAMGKSLATNALMHRRDLSKISASGGACTASAIKYVHNPAMDDHSDIYSATVLFKDDSSLREMAQELIRNYDYFQFSDKLDADFCDEDEQLANTAHDFFRMIFNADHDRDADRQLRNLLTKSEIMNNNLLRGIITMAHRRIEEAGANEHRMKKFPLMEIRPMLQATHNFMSHHKTLPSMWPIVQEVRISMGSALLRQGVSVIDCPGLGDLNHSRTAVTNSIRRQAQFEIVFGKSDRIETDELVHYQLKQSIKAHGARNTLLVLTKIDEFLLDDAALESIVAEEIEHPFPTIKKYGAAAVAAIDEICKDEEEATNEDFDSDTAGDQIELLDEYRDYLTKTAQCSYLLQRAKRLEDVMRYKFLKDDPNPISVVSISASMYLSWAKQ